MKLRDLLIMTLAFLLLGIAYSDRMQADEKAAERERAAYRAKHVHDAAFAELDRKARYMTAWERIK